MLSNHTSNPTSTQSLGVSLQESSSRMERSGGFNVLESRLVGERERKVEGYIYSHPRKCPLCIFWWYPDHPRLLRIIRGRNRIGQNTLKIPRSGSSGIGPHHPTWATSGRSQVTRSGSSALGPDHPDLLRNFSHCWAGSSDPVQKLVLRSIW